MKYTDFREKVLHLPVIPIQYLKLWKTKDPVLNNQIVQWTNEGKLIRLRKGLYLLNDKDRKIQVSQSFLAGQIYTPSYISLEYALSHYGIIPERTMDITSISSRKTAAFINPIGHFTYQQIQVKLFTGFKAEQDESGLTFYMAEPEKAIVDFIYLNQPLFKGTIKDVFRDSLRFQHLNILNKEKLLKYAALFSSKKVFKITQELK